MSTPQQAPSQPLLHEENARLQRAVHELSVLNDLALAIGGVQQSREIIQTIIHRSLRAVSAEQGVITLAENEEKLAMRTLVRTMDGRDAGMRFHLDQQLLGWMYIHKQALLIDSPSTDDRFKGVQWDPSIRSVLCVPLMVKSTLRGVLTVYNKIGDVHFTSDDQRLLAIIASQSAQILENARLLESEKTLQRMQEDLRVAAQIQQNLLPQSPPEIADYEIAGMTLPAQTVGGDYFDYFPIGNSRFGLALGDVSGKGLPASLLMANVQATLRGQALWVNGAAECLERANRQLFLSTSSDRFVTLFFALLDVHKHTITYCNAGQESPILMSADGSSRMLTTGGPLLGVTETIRYEEETLPLNPGDLLVVFSDGFTEATNPDGVFLGEQQILSVVQENREKDVPAILTALLSSTAAYSGKTPQSDDRTVLAIRRRNKG
jgi:phosphoserine phosphatase RsbU/P